MTGGLRWRQNRLKPDQNYVNSSGQFSLLLGYRFKRFSIESGYSKFSANNNYQFAYKGYDPILISFHNYVMSAIPLSLKYDMDVTGREAIRFGVLFSGNYALRDRSKTEYESKGTGSLNTPDGTVYEYDAHTINDKNLEHKRLFLNAGV
ncbi:hypothetical protein [Anditalea andensis]|uniref:Uncharacterized protein n=1 Tax=Anditalea andensis TaxID=1048983 RepID=A0A074KQ05_9BACT|nr:hypothetical protein [Anditalea andensis]KEO72031.1 hypothetical protein EL17_19135 [Anditalea andensis]